MPVQHSSSEKRAKNSPSLFHKMAQPDGSYPRLNAALLQSGQFEGMIVSMVGKLVDRDAPNNLVVFQCCDGGQIKVDEESAPMTDVAPDEIVEIVGSAQAPNRVMVSFC